MAISAVTQLAASETDFAAFQRAYPDFMLHIRALRKLRDREFGKLAGLTDNDRRSRVRSLLNMRSLHLLYAYEAIRKSKRLGGATPETISELALRCNPFQRSREPGLPHWVPARGRWRLVTSFGPEKRMRQLLVADLIRFIHPPLEQQYLFRGGMPAAFRAVEAAYCEGFTCAAEIDVIDFYGSVMLEGLAETLRPLPSNVVRHVVWDGGFGSGMRRDDFVSVFMVDDDDPSPNVQRGIALGSACSPIVGERILAMLIASADPCRIVAYADNLLVLGQSPEAVRVCVEHMRRWASGSAGWTLGLRIGATHDLSSDTFDFLHHEGRVEGDVFIWSPDQRKLAEFLLAESDDDLSLDEIAAAERKVSNWRRAYPDWPEGVEWETHQLAALAARRFYQHATPLNRSRAVHGIIESYFSWGRLRGLGELAPTGNFVRDEGRRAELIAAAEHRLIQMAQRAGWDADAIRCRATDPPPFG